MNNAKLGGRGDGGFGSGVRVYAEPVAGGPRRRGHFSLGGAAARALPWSQPCKSLRHTARWALLGFVGPLNLKKIWRYLRTATMEKLQGSKRQQPEKFQAPRGARAGAEGDLAEKHEITKRTHFKNARIA